MPVSETQCRSRHRWLAGILVTLAIAAMTVFGSVSGFTFGIANDAMTEAEEAHDIASEQQAVSVVKWDAVDDKLDTLQEGQSRIDKKLDQVLLSGGE